MSVSLMDLAGLAAAIIAAGIVTGLLAGLFGIGGGAVIVPVLYEAFRAMGVPSDVRMQLCVGTSLAIIGPTALRSYQTYREKGAVLTEVVHIWRAPSIAGVAVGAIAAAFAPSGLFKAAFAVVACVIAMKLVFGSDDWQLGSDLPPRLPMILYGFAIGLGSSLMGIGGGSLVTLTLTLYRKSVHQAVATASGVGVPIALAGTIGYCLAGLPHLAQLPPSSAGFVSLIGVVLIAPISSYVAPFSARLAHRMPRRRLEIAFAIFLVAVAARFAASLL